MPGLEFAFSAHGVVVLIASACAVALSVWFYRTTLPPVPRSQRALLTILRALALSIVALLLFSPTLRLLGTSVERPEVSILIDNSKSMRLTDHTGDRAAVLRSLLNSQALSRLGHDATLRFSTFGLHPHLLPSLASDTLAFNEEATDIATALYQQARDRSRQNIRAVILLTDGMYTLGENPLSRVDELGLPVYTVGIGDSSQPKDIAIAHIAANALATAGSITPVEITVQSSGFDGEHVEVRLEEGSTLIDRHELDLGGGTRTYPIRLNYQPGRDGTVRLTARVSVLPGEVTPANNTRSVTIRVLKSALKILLIAGSPEPDVSAVRQSIAEQPNLAVRSYTELRDGSFAEGGLLPSAVDSADCLILIGMPTANTSADVLSALGRMLNERRVPLLYIAGKSVAASKLNQLGSALPFSFAAVTPAEVSVSVLPAEAERGNPLIDLEAEGSFEAWKRLPPIYRSASPIRTLPGASILANSSGQPMLGANPLIVTRTLARQKSLAILGYGVWRWRLMGQEDPATQHLFDAFLFAGIRWLTSPEDSRRFKVTPTKELVPLGEPAEFTAQLYGNAADPLSDARIRVVVTSGQQVVETDLQPDGNGRYTGSVAGLGEGSYRFRATAEWHGGTAGADSGSFSVGGLDLEFRDPRMNAQLLRQIAYRTGGHFFTPASADRLDSLITAQPTFASRELRSVTDIELWHSRTLLIILIALLAAEWTLRKWLGMI
jgi:hypothetical protein